MTDRSAADRAGTSRRAFLASASTLSAAVGLGATGGLFRRAAAAPPDDAGAGGTKKILFLGGTGFIGPHIVRRLVDAGHEVTLFNRGNRDALFPGLERIVGNRIPTEGAGLEPLRTAIAGGRRWDAVIDTANVHAWTEHGAALLKDAADRYHYVSSMSVYMNNAEIGQDETAATATMPEEEAAKIDRLPYDMAFFGAVKRLSEVAAERHFPGRTSVIRPGLIVGPGDGSQRFTYWPWRVRKGGEVLAPGAPDHRVTFIDVRDLADFHAKLIAEAATGIHNVNGPVGANQTIGGLLEGCRGATGSDATFTWVDGDWLAERGVGAWAQMPVWIPPAPGMQGFHAKSIAKAVAAGLTTRPLADTVQATLAWLDDEYVPGVTERGGAYEPGVRHPGITPEREAELLAEWNARAVETPEAPDGEPAPRLA